MICALGFLDLDFEPIKIDMKSLENRNLQY